jgi:hypothetical protein
MLLLRQHVPLLCDAHLSLLPDVEANSQNAPSRSSLQQMHICSISIASRLFRP